MSSLLLLTDVPHECDKDRERINRGAESPCRSFPLLPAGLADPASPARPALTRPPPLPLPRPQEHLIPNSAWRDYSAANTNYAFEAFESEEKPGLGQGASSNGSSRSNGRDMVDGGGGGGGGGRRPPGYPQGGPQDTRSLQRPRGAGPGPGGYVPDRSTYSLPRTAHAHGPAPVPHNGYYTQDRRSQAARELGLQPDFYFMPSQRKYSGEVVRVYVDYNTTPRK
ncbi:Protein ABIL4 [Frankliniella fusca]|uniref:Protein ABIL4 n=1 Tax=Frankliniella fusca TaxID=407009 RepID=A0AAE1LNA5_9NEOP|nr:Protein ABIL4 [Frankliniella fusca]